MKNGYLKLSIYILALHALLLGAYSAIAADDMTMHRSYVGELDGTGWTTAKSTEGKFSVRLPNIFNDFTVRTKDPASPVERAFVVGTTLDGIKFMATRITYSKPDGANTYFNRFLNGGTFPAAKRTTGKFKGYPFAEIITSDDRQGTFYMRALLIQEDVITMTIEEPVAQKGVGAKLTTIFFESLTFDP